jgi:hypothetical protein
VDKFVYEKCTTSFNIILGLQLQTVTGNLWKAGNFRFLMMRLIWLDQDLMSVESNSRDIESCNLGASKNTRITLKNFSGTRSDGVKF